AARTRRGRAEPGAGRRDRGRRGHRQPSLHDRAARPRPGDPHLRRAAAVGVPAVAVGVLGVLLLRLELAGLPPRRLPAGRPLLRHPQPPLRQVAAEDGRAPAARRQRVATPAAASSSRALARVSSATAAVYSSRTVALKPSATASRAVARTQWSVAMPTTGRKSVV